MKIKCAIALLLIVTLFALASRAADEPARTPANSQTKRRISDSTATYDVSLPETEVAVSRSENIMQSETDCLRAENERLRQILADNGISDEERNSIDTAYAEAMSNPDNWSTAGMSNTTVEYANMWKSEMERYLALLTDELQDDKKQWVARSQEKWELFTKEQEELEWQTYDQMCHGGSIMSNLSASIYYNKYRTRALVLKLIYDSLGTNSDV